MAPGVLDEIGRTPLVRLRGRPRGGELHGKLELLNPFGMKDRVAKHILLEARRRGLLAEGAPVVESSSGTMALGVALVGGALGHPVHVVTDPRIDPITSAKLHAFDVLVGPVGSGGSLCGTARSLQRANAGVRVVAVDSAGSAIFGPARPPGAAAERAREQHGAQ